MNVLIVCIDALRGDHVTEEIMPSLFLQGGDHWYDTRAGGTWTNASVATLLYEDRRAWEKGKVGMCGAASLPALFRSTHATGAFIGQPTLATSPWLFSGFDTTWWCSRGGWWGAVPDGMVWDQFLGWQREQWRPWLAYVHLFGAHEPYRYVDEGPDPGAPEGLDDTLRRTLAAGYFTPIMERGTGRLEVSAECHAYLREAYQRHCTALDGRLSGFWETIPDGTLVVLMSDHGDALGEEGMWGHGNLPGYHGNRGVERVACCVAGPDGGIGLLAVDQMASVLARVVRSHMRSLEERDATEQHLRSIGYL